MQIFVPPPPPSALNWFDAAAVGVLLLFGWRGYRRGLVAWLAGIGASVLALAAAYALTPALSPIVAGHSALGGAIVERLTFVALLFLLRFLLGWALREFVASLRPVLRALPPLNLLDHVLGVLPSLTLGLVLILAVLAVALLLPVDGRLHAAAAQSYAGRVTDLEAGHALAWLTSGIHLSAPPQILRLI